MARLQGCLAVTVLCVAVASCGGEGGDAPDMGGGDAPEAGAAALPQGGIQELDVCGLLTREEVSAVIGMTAGPPAPEDSPPPFFGCRYEADDITPVVTVGVIAWEDADQAASSFAIGADQYEAVEGLGDRAYRSQPIDDITVLYRNYEVSVGLYFVSEDADTDFAMARRLAETVMARLP